MRGKGLHGTGLHGTSLHGTGSHGTGSRGRRLLQGCLLAKAVVVAGLLAALLPALPPAAMADPVRCYALQERRAVIAARKAIPLARAVRAVGRRVPGETVRAELCEEDRRLIYRLTILARNGRVTRATVDAITGQILSGR